MRVITFGTFDLFHIGHVNILTRAHDLGSHLTVGVSTDALTRAKKGRDPARNQDERVAVVAALACVDEVFLEESLELKRDYLLQHRAEALVMGDDWAGRFDEFNDIVKVIYLPRTLGVSTTHLIHTALNET